VTVHELDPSRRNRMDLLMRPPCGVGADERGWSALIVDQTDQLEALADLRARGLLSTGEFEREKAKVLEQ
jgi:hypothetical protein